MNKRLIRELACVTILSLVFLSCLAFAQPAAEGPAEQEEAKLEGEEIPISDIVQELGLSAEQKEQLKEQRFQEEYNRIDTRNKIRLKELELRRELETEVINQEAINKIVAELKGLYGITVEQRVASILKLREILTPEQFEKLQSYGERRRQQRRQKFLRGLKNKFQDSKNQ